MKTGVYLHAWKIKQMKNMQQRKLEISFSFSWFDKKDIRKLEICSHKLLDYNNSSSNWKQGHE